MTISFRQIENSQLRHKNKSGPIHPHTQDFINLSEYSQE